MGGLWGVRVRRLCGWIVGGWSWVVGSWEGCEEWIVEWVGVGGWIGGGL